MDEREHRIRERAHRLWEEEGRPEGHAERHWFQAEEIVAIEEAYPENPRAVDAAEAPLAEPIGALADAGEGTLATESHTIHPVEEPPQARRGKKRPRPARSE